MLNVVLDTTAYRADPKREKAGFRALARLAGAQELTLHIPEVVRREFISQQRAQYSQHIHTTSAELHRFRKRLLPDRVAQMLEESANKLYEAREDLASFADKEFDEWVVKISAIQHPVRDSHGARVVDAYFNGQPPFREPKRRDDFPDAFVWQTVLDLAESCDPVFVVSSDKTILAAADSHAKIQAYASLEDFVASAIFQGAQRKHFASANLKAILQLLPAHAQRVAAAIESPLVDELVGKSVHSGSIPDDNSEATVLMVGAPTDLELDTARAVDHGEGLFVIPFSLCVECLLSYAIFKGDFYVLSDEKSDKIGISDLNDHYFDAEEDYELQVEGLLAFEVDADALNENDLLEDNLVEILHDANVTIDSVDTIDVVEEYREF